MSKQTKFPEINVINANESIDLRFPKPNLWVSGVLMLLAGSILPLAFAPFSYALLAILSLIFYSYVLLINAKKSFLLGFLFGLGFFGIGISWVSVSMHNFGNMALPLAYLATFLFVCVLALFTGASAWLACKIRDRFSVGTLVFAWALIPTTWILFEWLRSWILTGFPWLILGVSQVESPLGAVLPLVGETGTSWLVVMFAAAALLVLVGDIKVKGAAMLLVAGTWLGVGFLNTVAWTTPTGKELSVALVQGNTPLVDKWNPRKQPQIIETYVQETNKKKGVDLVVWPETAVPSVYQSAKEWLDDIPKNTTLISGIIYENNNRNYHNSLVQLDDKKEVFYHKRHLVPFGEYTPLANNIVGWVMGGLDIPMSNLVPGENPSNTLTLPDGTVIAPSICYEVAYSDLIRQDTSDANLLLTVSNDTWFGRSLAPAQHLQIAQARAKENGKPMIRATNTGLTATMNAQGVIQKQLPEYQLATLVDTIATYQGSTPYSRYGSWPFLGFLMVLLGVILIQRQRKS